jgi:hypothetical protein
MALKEAFHTVNRLVYRDKDGKRVVVPAGRDDFNPESAKQRDDLLKSGAIRPIKVKLSAAATAEAEAAAEAAKTATGNGPSA